MGAAAAGASAATLGSAALISGYGIDTEILAAGGAVLAISLAMMAFRKVNSVFNRG